MEYTNLKKSPEFVKKTITLIERSFEYKSPNSFQTDFYPLINPNNHENCYIIVVDDKVIAHIGVLTRNLEHKEKLYPINMYGGIAVDEDYRGQGLFKSLFNNILPNYQDCAFHLLWSNKIDLYTKLDFYPCINLNEYPEQKSDHPYNIEQTKLKNLTEEQLNSVKDLYKDSHELRIHRDDQHWQELTHIESADLYLIKQENEIKNYFIKNKGQDLPDIIHEYGYLTESYLKAFQNYGKLWTPFTCEQEAINLFASLLRIGDANLFMSFIKDYADIEITGLNSKEVHFNFNNEGYTFAIDEFLQGILGPGRFKEIVSPQLFISGLDSI